MGIAPKIAPDRAHCPIAAAIDEASTAHLVAVTDKRIVTAPFVHTEVAVKAVS